MTGIEGWTAARRRHLLRWVMWPSLAVPVAAVIIYLLIWYGPDVIASHDIGSVTGPLRVVRLQQARDAARGHLLTLGAGLFAAGALLFTGRNYGLSRRTLDVSQRTLAMAEQGQVTDRYTRAIEQLGSDKLDVRIGGIYALERIARDSAADRATIGEVLTAFVRTHAPWPPSLPGQYVATAPIHQVPKLQTRAPDVQACLWVLGRGGFADALAENEWLDLSAVDLRRADLRNARLGAADLRFAGLQRVYLGGAHLEGAYLGGSHLEGARLLGARLDKATFGDAHLEGVIADGLTSWPDGFDWRAAGVTLAE